jgi:hypothetical protein
MDNKKKAAELIMAFLPIVGQDPYTGITTAKDCAKVSVNLLKDAQQDIDWEEVIQHIDSF